MQHVKRLFRGLVRRHRSAFIVRLPLAAVFFTAITAVLTMIGLLTITAAMETSAAPLPVATTLSLGLGVVLVNLVVGISAAVLPYWAGRQIQRRVLAARGRLCPTCMHDLR
ncbi:MAG: hypothetical protein K2X32_02020, partial [Phycisphaerales bacterium]|nr:hypothetical protein [Phycisphaerales bacterium]